MEYLLLNGHSVKILDNLSGGRLENLTVAMKDPRCTFHVADITDVDTIRPHFREVDWVFHLAALADIVPSIQHPMEYHNANVDGTVSVLEAAKEAQVKRFIYAASSSCYGIPDAFPTPVNAPTRPMYPYALTKYVGEQYALHWCQVYGLPTLSLRFFNVYGPRSRTSGAYGAVFGTFLAQKLAGKPYTVVGDGNQTRDFVYVTDVTKALVKAAESCFSGKIFNIGSGGTYSINHLVSLLGGDVVYLPKRPGEPDCTFADIGLTVDELGWRPEISFEEGIELMLEGIDHWRNAPIWDRDSIAEATKDWFAHLGR